MKKPLRFFLAVLLVCLICLFFGFNYLSMTFSDGADYTEQDRSAYNFYTPDLLKNLPRISHSYRFHYSNVSGPNPALRYQAIFFGTTDQSKIEIYLERNGFQKTEVCTENGGCWIGSDPDITVSVTVEKNPDAIHVEMLDKADQAEKQDK